MRALQNQDTASRFVICNRSDEPRAYSKEQLTCQDGRSVNVFVEYPGVLSENAFDDERQRNSDFSMAQVNVDEIRERSFSVLGDTPIFRICCRSLGELDTELTKVELDEEARAQIIRVVGEGNNAPKYERVQIGEDTRNKIIVVVTPEGADPDESKIKGNRHDYPAVAQARLREKTKRNRWQ